MARIDTSGWKEFRIGSLFVKQELHCRNPGFNKKVDVSEEQTDEFSLPLVNAKFGNNGIMFYGRPADFESASMCLDIVQNGAVATGSVYAQPQETGVLWDAYLIKPVVDVSETILLYLSTVMERHIKQKYGYDNKAVWEKVRQDMILLPVDAAGEPDWAYMEDYIRGVETAVGDSLTRLRSAKNSEPVAVDTAEWSAFRVGSLFEKQELKCLKKDWDKAFDISIERTDEFDLPLVNAKNDNNGIMYYGRNCDYESVEMSLDIVCDGASSTGNVFAQPQRTGVLYNAYLIKCNGAKSKYALMFLARVMQNVIKDRYGYENKAGWEKVKNEVILLPVDTTGEPNWAYMERYMMALEQKVVAVLRHFGLWSNIGNICAKC